MVDQPEDKQTEKPKAEKSKTEKVEEKKSEKTLENKLSDLASKMPDISGITNKIDLDKILGGIKSMINPERAVESKSNIDPKDALGMEVAELSALLLEISKTHAKLSKDFSKANDLLAGLFRDIEAIRSSK